MAELGGLSVTPAHAVAGNRNILAADLGHTAREPCCINPSQSVLPNSRLQLLTLVPSGLYDDKPVGFAHVSLNPLIWTGYCMSLAPM